MKLFLGLPKKIITKLSIMRMPENFNWIVSWNVTYRCNLKCNYCHFHALKDNANIEKSSGVVAKLKPKYLIVTGGEPLILPNISEIVRKTWEDAKKPFLIVNTNATVHLDRLYTFLDIINTVHISIDGLGMVNTKNRGVSGDFVLNQIKAINKEIKHRNLKTAILTMTVVTTENYRHVPELVDRLFSEFDDIFISIT
ncbi:radical SAM protein, partial [bacterium]|nr:radical SAM protein [bacterium]